MFSRDTACPVASSGWGVIAHGLANKILTKLCAQIRTCRNGMAVFGGVRHVLLVAMILGLRRVFHAKIGLGASVRGDFSESVPRGTLLRARHTSGKRVNMH